MAATNFNVYFYRFTKKINSTRTPVNGAAGLQWEVHTCYLRRPSSVISPVLELSFNRNRNGGDGGTYDKNIGEKVLEFNYCYIPRFDRYYFIDEKVWDDGFFVLTLTCDVLATYKQQIGDYKGFVLRSSFTRNNFIEDTNRTIIGVGGSSSKGFKTLYQYSPTYIMGVNCNSEAPSYGGITYFAGTGAEISQVLQLLARGWLKSGNSSTDWTPASSEEIAVLKPLEMVKTLSVIPFSVTASKNITEIYYNGYKRELSLKALTELTQTFDDITLEFDLHPQINTLPYTAFSPYSEHYVNLPGVGVMKLNSDEFIGGAKDVSMIAKMDLIQGNIQYRLGFVSGAVYTYEGNLGLGGPISGTMSTGSISAIQESTSAVNTALGVVTLGIGVAGAISSLGASIPATLSFAGIAAGGLSQTVSSINTGIGASAGKASTYGVTVGSHGSRANIYSTVIGWSIFKSLSDISNKTMGQPLCSEETISDIPGYILMKDASVDIDGTSDEKNKVNYYLNTGFYYEEDA